MSHNRRTVRESFNDFPEPIAGEEEIAVIKEPRGSNQVLVELEDGSQSLVIIPSKYHKLLYLRKETLVIVRMEQVQKLEESKVVGSLVCPLHPHQVKHLLGLELIPAKWRAQFQETDEGKPTLEDMMPPSDSDEYDNESYVTGSGLNHRRADEESDSSD